MDNKKEEIRQRIEKSLRPDHFRLHQEPDPSVPGSEGSVTWYDFEGVTFGKTEADQKIIDLVILEMVERMVGFPVERVKEMDGNGHCTLWYKRAVN